MERSQVVSDTVLNLLGVRHCLCKTSPVPAFLRSLSHPLVHSLSGTCHWRTVSWTRQPPCLFLKSWSKMNPSCLQLLLVRHLVTSLWKGINKISRDRKREKTTLGCTQLWLGCFSLWSSKGQLWGVISTCPWRCCLGGGFFVLTLLQRCWTAGKWLGFNTGTGRSWKLLISRNGHCRPFLTSTQ